MEALASGKVVWGDPCTEGSQTAKVGTDEQKLDTRHDKLDKQAHHCNVQTQKVKCLLCRFSSDWRKENALTWGGLSNHELDWEKSAEVIVVTGNEPNLKDKE